MAKIPEGMVVVRKVTGESLVVFACGFGGRKGSAEQDFGARSARVEQSGQDSVMEFTASMWLGVRQFDVRMLFWAILACSAMRVLWRSTHRIDAPQARGGEHGCCVLAKQRRCCCCWGLGQVIARREWKRLMRALHGSGRRMSANPRAFSLGRRIHEGRFLFSALCYRWHELLLQ